MSRLRFEGSFPFEELPEELQVTIVKVLDLPSFHSECEQCVQWKTEDVQHHLRNPPFSFSFSPSPSPSPSGPSPSSPSSTFSASSSSFSDLVIALCPSHRRAFFFLKRSFHSRRRSHLAVISMSLIRLFQLYISRSCECLSVATLNIRRKPSNIKIFYRLSRVQPLSLLIFLWVPFLSIECKSSPGIIATI